jgi:hypothetical protein
MNDEDGNELSLETRIAIKHGVVARPSVLLGQMQALRVAPPEFWANPLERGDALKTVAPYLECQRFYFDGRPDEVEVPFLDEQEQGLRLYAILKGEGQTYASLKELVSAEQRSLLGRLQNAGMLEIR